MCIKNFASYRCGCTIFSHLTLCDRNDGSCERPWAAPDPANWSIRNSAFLCPGCFRRSQPERPNVYQPRLSAEQVSAREAMLEDARNQIRDLELEKQQRELDARIRELEFERALAERQTQVRVMEHVEEMEAAERRMQFLQAGVELRALDREVEEEEEHLSRFRAQQSSARRAQELQREREVSGAESHIRALEHQEKMAGLNEKRRYLQAGLESRALQEEIDQEEGEASRSRSSRSKGP
ncbi:hypothetical protein MBM_09743 [Drepanopeziza brunnea f. sp. 'multigermtubi' MB_m1]|uniref:Uncharacterized protein n=1 Tax=Marssonina brunnea f. sp. multigermtubi (strain MB_m1) TaxID=1072389 RepID=K1WH03_MARBU|nr:uncharacterized protein MBM_09743 [Drepanopeziza brunnea f. sp. 'multigermtubi' MB_m1]EKD12106.1 hypothetical protein MBM_09743 [Drepanopeziza brunnea f. sp. 'multigermtubi' MB_m1]